MKQFSQRTRRTRHALVATLCCSLALNAQVPLGELAKNAANTRVAIILHDGTKAEGRLKSVDVIAGGLTLKGRNAPLACASIASVTFEPLSSRSVRVLLGLTSIIGLSITGGQLTQRRLLSNKTQGAAMLAGVGAGALIAATLPKRMRTVTLACPD
jgi:hypothetical protein